MKSPHAFRDFMFSCCNLWLFSNEGVDGSNVGNITYFQKVIYISLDVEVLSSTEKERTNNKK